MSWPMWYCTVQLSGRDFSFHTGIAMEPGRVVALWKCAQFYMDMEYCTVL